MLSDYIFEHGFKPSIEPSLDQNLNALLFENHDGGLNENLLYEILRRELILVFFVPPFHFFVLFFTPTGNILRWKAVKHPSQLAPVISIRTLDPGNKKSYSNLDIAPSMRREE